MFTKFFSTTVLLLGMFVLPVVSLAAGHTVAPLAKHFDLESRDIIHDTITLTNTTGQQIRLYASVNQVSTDGDGVLESFKPPVELDRTNEPTSWIEITRGRIELKPGESQEIPYTIRMNPKTKPGDYDVFIGFATGSNQPAATKKVLAGQAPGTLLRISVDKKQNQFLRLERYVIDTVVTGNGSSTATVALFNPGLGEVIPRGEIIFYDNGGSEIAAAPINDAAVAVPGEGRTSYTVVLPDDLSFGKYKAFLSLEYGEDLTASLNDTEFFYVIPLTQLLLLFAALVLVVALLTWLMYRRYEDDDFDDHTPVPLFVSDRQSARQDHDIDLKSTPL